MFCRLSLLAFVAPLVSALTLQIPENPTTDGSITIKWTSAPNDPETWSFELTNVAFNQAFAIANNVNPTAGQLTLTLPAVPVGDGYTLEAVNIGNINDVFASTPDFAIGPATSAVSSASSTSATASKALSTGSSKSVVTTPASSSTPATSNIVTSNTATTPTTPSTTSSGTTSPAGATPFSGALSSHLGSGSVGGIAAVLLSAAAGAAMIAL